MHRNMVMKKIWICENEENEARKFLHILKTLPEVKGKIRVFCEERHLQTMAFDIRSLPDLVFMDLAFGDHKGIQAAENIRKKCGSIPLVFMSENPEDIEKIFESEPSYFIHKPVTLEALFAALRWGERHLPPQDEKAVVVMEKGMFYRIPCNELQYVESHKRVATFVGEEKRCSVYIKLDDLEQMLPSNFLRCHKSYLVNMNFIENFTVENILLFSGQKISVSRGKYHEAKEKFREYLLGELPA